MPLSPAVDGVWLALANDLTIRSFKGYDATTTIATIAQNYIFKSEETDGVVMASTIPLILIYTRPGKPDPHTKQMYNDKIVIDVFAGDDYRARQMADRVFDVLHNAQLQTPTFTVPVCRFAYATSWRTGINGVRAHRLFFDVSYYIG